MKHVVRGAVVVGCALASLVGAGAASAANPHPLYPNPVGPFELSGYCAGFNVQAQYTRNDEHIISQTTAADGTVIQRVTGDAVIALTNESTGRTLTYNASGPGTVTVYPDGSFAVSTTGPSLFWTLPQNSYSGVPTIAYTTGPVSFFVNASGLTTRYSYQGHQTDVCAALGS